MNQIFEAHRILFPNQQFTYNYVYECDKIKKGIDTLYNSSRQDKNAIFLELGSIANVIYNPNVPLRDILLEIKTYYMDICLSLPDTVGAKLAMKWGLGVQPHYESNCDLVNSIITKITTIYKDKVDNNTFLISVLYDPNIGMLNTYEKSLERIDKIRSLPYFRSRDMAERIVILKLTRPDRPDLVSKLYNEYVKINSLVGVYVSDGELNIKEINNFLSHHKALSKLYDIDVYYKFRTAQDELFHRLSFTKDELNFILNTARRYLNGDYPFDMKWLNLCY